ncbi:D-methionine transport system ATP-binding protein [Ruminococcaceae bacterium FB2012]|nr:D-methionine transport system ATP-binding protein [Ruminococcaceae bacterium FB2012]
MIELKSISKTFKTKKGSFTALRDIDLTVNDGEIFGIIGLSGAGKSTLVRCINYLEKPTSGKVIIDGRELGSLKKKELLELRRNIGMIFQSFNLLEQRTVLKNVLFPLEIAGLEKDKAISKARELLELVGLSDKESSYPSQLSGGQKQRVAIARALASEPKYLLCDEATSALDPDTTRSILELIRRINRELGVTTVVITHDMKVIDSICDRVAVMDSSVVTEVGTVAEVFSDPKSETARKLILPELKLTDSVSGGQRIRLIFSGESSFTPVVSNLILSCGTPLNILYAKTKDIDGHAYGEMVLQLPDDERAAAKVKNYLEAHVQTYSVLDGGEDSVGNASKAVG